jgi:hypothetical protein
MISNIPNWCTTRFPITMGFVARKAALYLALTSRETRKATSPISPYIAGMAGLLDSGTFIA